jgi:uncharacterized SAM-binding protein YcdF (DUF218 family)
VGYRALTLVALTSALSSAGCYNAALVEVRQIMYRQGPPRGPYDAIIVPGCPTRRDGGPSTCILRRMRVAVRAHRDQLAPRILVSGATVHTKGVEAEVMRDVALELGVPRDAVLVEDQARHTTENLEYAARMLLPRGWRRVLIVTDTFQLPFAMQFARMEGLVADAQPTLPPLHSSVVREHVELDDVEPIPFICWW